MSEYWLSINIDAIRYIALLKKTWIPIKLIKLNSKIKLLKLINMNPNKKNGNIEGIFGWAKNVLYKIMTQKLYYTKCYVFIITHYIF